MILKVALDEGAVLPNRAHETDGGFDLFTPQDVLILPNGSATVDTGVHVEIPRGYVGMIKSKSGLNVKRDLVAEGVIDCGYTGSIVVKMYNKGKRIQTIKKGEKITQLVVMPIADIDHIEWVDKLDENTERGNNGFGSTGK